MQNSENKGKLPLNLRILIGLAGLPSLILAYMLLLTIVEQGVQGISAFELVYSVVGVFALYIAITGKRPF
jgi:hypothetical protein|tara:strand:- start:744 stop:953 length:210 start_codon:yes stop_codon:yes gene_type:complete